MHAHRLACTIFARAHLRAQKFRDMLLHALKMWKNVIFGVTWWNEHFFKACSNISRNFCARKCAPIDAHAKTKHFSYLHRPHNFKTHASMTMQSFAKIFKNGTPPRTFEPPWTQHARYFCYGCPTNAPTVVHCCSATVVETVVATPLNAWIFWEGHITTERILYTDEGGKRLMERIPIERSEGENSSRIPKSPSHNNVGAQTGVLHSIHITTHNLKDMWIFCIMKLVA